MIKQIFLIKRKEGMSFADFKKHYLETHAPLFKGLFPKVQKYIVNLAMQRGKETPYDAITEIYWENFEAIIEAVKSEAYKNSIRPDEETFIGSMQAVLVEEYPQKGV